MDKLVINGGGRLFGTISVSGSKNAVLPIMAATLIEPGIYQLKNVPNLKDTRTMIRLLEMIGAKVEFANNKLLIDSRKCNNPIAPYDLVKTMRASFYVLGPLLSRFKEATVSLPGGCAWGPRPVDYHLKALEEMGGKVSLDYGNIVIKGDLKGSKIKFKKISVGATGNVIMAAVKAKGTTEIHNASMEPEIANLVTFLNDLGADIISYPESNLYIINGVERLLSSSTCKIIPDRIEAGTYMIAVAFVGGEVAVKNICSDHLIDVIEKIRLSGADVSILKSDKESNDSLIIKSSSKIVPVDMSTSEYPGFPTDLQAQWMALMTLCSGDACIVDNIYKDRFTHIAELKRFGAKISLNENKALVRGVDELQPAPVMSTDIRASASLVIAALKASGRSEISRIYHLDRGYENIVDKLNSIGADIKRVDD